MNTSLVKREDRGPIAVLTLNRPSERNALSRALMSRLRDLVDDVAVEPKVRAVVLTGAGPAFCAGIDLKEAAEIHARPEAEAATIQVLQEFADLLQKIHANPKPVIAAVNGPAVAGGAGLTLSCDLAVASETASIGYPEVRRGLVAAVVMHDLTRQVGERRARQLLLGGELISSKVALEWGLFNSVTSHDRCLDEAIRLAEGLTEGAPDALATTKRLLDEALSRPPNLRGAAAVSAAVRFSAEAKEGVRAFVENRPPAWAVVHPADPAQSGGGA
jgi:methylglutaconyl-CoA hydratase